jgi:hypothetical protein
MNKLLRISLFSMAALLPLRAQAQVLCALGPTSPPYEPMADMPASAGAQAELKKIKTLLCPKGCGKVLLFANATTPNTATVTDGAGGSKIAYSPSFVGSIQKNYGPAGTFGILAHALGHHLEASGNRPAWMKDAWDSELRADAWAGCAIAKAEMTPSRLQAVLLAMSSYPSSHHPPWSERRPVITEGYTRCGGRILPPLAKETAELAVKSDKNNDKHSGGEPVTVAIGLGGCTGDRDCRNGRACVNSHCVTAPERKRCGKDIDCPEPQECGPSGVCVSPGGSATPNQARVEDEAPKPPGPLLASLQEPKGGTSSSGAATTDAPGTATSDVPTCRRACDEVRNQCVDAVTSETNKCLQSIRSDPGYRSCGCPNYPAGNQGCYNLCANAYEKGKGCGAESLVRDCRADGERCRTQCK